MSSALAFLAACSGYGSSDGSTICLLCSEASSTNGHRFVAFADLERIADLLAGGGRGRQSDASVSCLRTLREGFAFSEQRVRAALASDPTLSGAEELLFGEEGGRGGRGLAICWKDCPLSQAVYYALAGRGSTAPSSSGASIDAGYFQYFPDLYEEHLLQKVERVRGLLNGAWAGQWPALASLETIASPRRHYRHRNRFGVSVNRGPGGPVARWMIWDAAGWPSLEVDAASFLVPSRAVCALLAPLARGLASDPLLLEGLQAAHFLSTTAGHVSVQLIYSSPTQQQAAWLSAAGGLRQAAMRDAPEVCELSLARRSRRQKLLVGREEVRERLVLADGRALLYEQVADSFSNPNAAINTLVLDHLCSISRSIVASPGAHRLLELFCGCGNHTVALAPLFEGTVGVEVSRALVAAARKNLLLNGCSEVASVLLGDAGKFTRGVRRREGFFGAGGGRFDCLLVDPPRAGLDALTRACVPLFDHVLYVSCDPASLARDLASAALTATHEVASVRCFDAFCYTPHIETVVHLRRRGLGPGGEGSIG